MGEKVIYRVATYDRTTEHMKGTLIVPPSIVARVKKIAGFRPRDDGLGEYPLDDEQTRRVAKILGFRPEPNRFHYYIEPYDPPEESGFQQETSTTR
jgi:hypothetical protein